MKRVPVSSSALASVGYDAQRRILEVEFVSGEVYHYLEVAAADVHGLFESESMGRFLNEQIKPHHEYVHVGHA